ncbi:hypothetical protein NKH80_26215 [Mesorhizobium sp. M0904]|uniref:hypothetical protein n=1 Tax=Mesorhizobium sp. M0904 TaxID=2957022 RepID=UPI003337B436
MTEMRTLSVSPDDTSMNRLLLKTCIQILTMLCEGSLMRSISRVADVSITNAFSKTFDNHVGMVALCTVWYNFHPRSQDAENVAGYGRWCRKRFGRRTILREMDAVASKPGKRGPYTKRLRDNG